MDLKVAGLDWDEGNRAKCQKHGVSIAQIEALFVRGPRIAPDIKHSSPEDRFIAVGAADAGRPIFVAFTLRLTGRGWLIRPISARYMHAREIEKYEKDTDAEEGSAAEKR
jgi:uncharacterized protein